MMTAVRALLMDCRAAVQQLDALVQVPGLPPPLHAYLSLFRGAIA
jgi:hypothetical protein